jgi:hypothetical protein
MMEFRLLKHCVWLWVLINVLFRLLVGICGSLKAQGRSYFLNGLGKMLLSFWVGLCGFLLVLGAMSCPQSISVIDFISDRKITLELGAGN